MFSFVVINNRFEHNNNESLSAIEEQIVVLYQSLMGQTLIIGSVVILPMIVMIF